jgi:D-3-phosphoglycerate dehydrogenase
VIVTNNPLTSAHIAALGARVRIIARAGIGLDALDLEAAQDRGVAIFHTPDYATAEVATHAVAMMLALNRRILEADTLARKSWPNWEQLRPIASFDQLTVGLVGLGRIGLAVAERLQPLAGAIWGYDPEESRVHDYVRRVSLEELLTGCDVVSLHLPLTRSTRGLIGAQELDRMRPTAIFVNVSRGGLVDETALANALATGRLAGAALDVLENEPPPKDSPVLSAPHLILSPHLAWSSDESERRVREEALEASLAYLAGAQASTGRMVIQPTVSGSGGSS